MILYLVLLATYIYIYYTLSVIVEWIILPGQKYVILSSSLTFSCNRVRSLISLTLL